jgi:hypothetical protein
MWRDEMLMLCDEAVMSLGIAVAPDRTLVP